MKQTQSSSEKWIQRGRRVWVKAISQHPNPFQDAFLQGQIISIEHSKHSRVFLTESKIQFKIPFQDCLKLTYGPKDVADMVDLEQLNQPELLFNIKRRYIEDCIFTYCGPTLLIINPYRKIERLFNDTVLQQYQSYVFSDTLQYKTLSPHVFGLAAFCLWQLFDNERNQSIVISGESGAGKTQNTKYCLKFLASLGKNMKQLINQSYSSKKTKMNSNLRAAQRAVKKTSSKVYGIEEKILGCNQILEAFGNSKTIRNDNSSRFGKLILLVYGQTQIQIKSAFIISYLLEKSRIVSVSQGERNYHIFYYFIKGTSQTEKKAYFLKPNINHYFYLNQSTVTSIAGISDQQSFHQIKKQFLLYLNEEEIQSVLKILSVVLNLGNITYKKIQTPNIGESAIVENSQYVKIISELLNVPYKELEHCFQFKTRKMGLNVINSPLRYDQAIALRDSFAKNIYEKTFSFLIKKMNQKIQIQQVILEEDKNSSSFRKSIGLLDIFGFQVLNTNSLQQFFINFANQKLQQLYVSYIFKQQQNEFMREGLRQFSHDIGFQDNKPIIDLFQNYPLGIFHLVNQSSELNQDDKDLPASIQKNHSKNIFLKIPKSKRSCFEILHSCSPVSYNTMGFTLKNKDQFPQQLLDILQQTKSESILKICIGEELKQKNEPNQKGGRNSSKKFLGSKFLNSMNTLIEQLYSCDCHFVRCIKPNSKKAAKLFNSEAVLQSLRYLGVLDSIIIRKLGYIYRRPFKEFYKKFYELDNYIFSFHEDVNQLKTQEDFKRQSQKIIHKYLKKQLDENNILLGHKKILIKESTLNHLELLTKEKRKLRINAANRFKAMYKNALFRTKLKTFLHSLKILKIHLKLLSIDIKEKILNTKVIKIQNVVKKFLWQKRLQKIKQEATKSVTRIAAYFKMKNQRKKYLEIKNKITSVQSNLRLFLTMGKIFRYQHCSKIVKNLFGVSWRIVEDKKAILIQKVWKGFQVRNKFKKAIQTIKKNLRLSKIKAKFKRALFRHKYNKFKQALDRYRLPIIKLQAMVRGKFLNRVYHNVKRNTILIQRVYRRHLKKKFYLLQEWKAYKKIIKQCQERKMTEMQLIGMNMHNTSELRKGKQLDETNGILRRLYPSEILHSYVSELGQSSNKVEFKGHKINETMEFIDKNTFQVYLMDYDSVSTTHCSTSVIQLYQNIKDTLKNRMEFITFIDLTQTHLIVVSNKDKIYRINLEDKNKDILLKNKDTSLKNKDVLLKNKEAQLSGIGILHRVNSSQNGSVIFTYKQSKIFEWGELPSLTTPNNKSNQNILPQEVNKQSVTNYSSKGQCQYVVCQPLIFQRSKVLSKETVQIMELPNKITINQVAPSHFFVHFLTNTGNIFSKGKNTRGELGLGFDSPDLKSLTLNLEIKKSKQFIQSIAVGLCHTVAKSKIGYVYGWGDNSFGQISGSEYYYNRPRRIEIDSKAVKAFQVTAGLKASYFLSESLKIQCCGASLGFESRQNKNLLQLSLLQKTNYKERFLNTIKLRCVWNSQCSLLFANAIDFSKCKQGSKSQAIFKYTKVIAKQWIQNTIYPPYHQFMDNSLNLADLRKLKFKQNTEIKLQNQNKKQDKLTQTQQLKMILQLRKTSTMLRQTAKIKIQQFLNHLNSKDSAKWTIEEKQLYDIIMADIKKASN